MLLLRHSLLHHRQGYSSLCTSTSLTLPCSTSWCWCSSGLVLKTFGHLLCHSTSGHTSSARVAPDCCVCTLSMPLQTSFFSLWTSLKWLSQFDCLKNRFSHSEQIIFLCFLLTCMLHLATLLKYLSQCLHLTWWTW